MALTTEQRDILDNAGISEQKVSLGTELYGSQGDITNIQAGKGITLPTSDPAVAGELWNDSGTVKVSAG